ncbi:MAG: hypothetical protein MJZ68_04230 [archaeon]|nr:hypothetical protein [archaeon]
MSIKMPDDFDNLTEIEYGYDGGDDDVTTGYIVLGAIAAVGIIGTGAILVKDCMAAGRTHAPVVQNRPPTIAEPVVSGRTSMSSLNSYIPDRV